jgi:opacity protein-like surface antigen
MKRCSAFAVALALLLPFAAPLPAAAENSPAAVPDPAPEASTQPASRRAPYQPTWGIGARYGSMGATNWVLDAWLEKHPSVDGSATGVELRYYGKEGSKAFSSLAIPADWVNLDGNGEWQEKADSELLTGGADLSMQAYTITAYYDLFPSLPIHPYFGIGVGYAKLSGDVTITSSDEIKTWKPKELVAVHIPVGLVLNVGKFVSVRGEVRFLDSLSYGGMVMLNF